MVVARLLIVFEGSSAKDGAARAEAAKKLTVRKDVNNILKKNRQRIEL